MLTPDLLTLAACEPALFVAEAARTGGGAIGMHRPGVGRARSHRLGVWAVPEGLWLHFFGAVSAALALPTAASARPGRPA